MALQYTFDIVDIYRESFPGQHLFHSKKNGRWTSISPEKLSDCVDKLAAVLYYEGIKQGEIVASIFAYNTYEWNIIDLAIARIGAIHLPVYPTISDSDYIFILNQAQVRWIFITGQVIYNKISELIPELPSVRQLISIEELPNVENLHNLLDRSPIEQYGIREKLNYIRNTITADTICTILYTSGTTGFPKGVMLSHGNLCSNTITASKMHPISHGDRVLSFLPICHIYERTSVYQFLLKGAVIYYAESLNTFLADVRFVKPHGLTVVPRMLEKIVIGLKTKAKKAWWVKRKIILWSISKGYQYNPQEMLKGLNKIEHKLFDLLVYRHMRNLLGGNIKYIGCGGALSNIRIMRFCRAAGLPVYEGYGLSECSPLVSLNAPGKGNFRLGTVGKVIDGVRVKIASDNEILVQGPNVMRAYFKNPLETQEAKKNNWFHTGDLGEINPEGFLIISGRKKEMFKTSYGKYIVPQAIENLFIESLLIEYIVVIGEGKHYAAAIIAPDIAQLRLALKIGSTVSDKEIINSPGAQKLIDNEIDKVNRKLGKAEKIRNYIIVEDTWTVETGEISATQKLKRNVIINKYNQRIHNLYRMDKPDSNPKSVRN